MTPRDLYNSWTAMAPALGNHLWQSTMFVLATGLLTLFLQKNQARIRYRLWLAASLKFLFPCSLLTAVGHRLAAPLHPVPTQAGLYQAIEQVSTPFVVKPLLSISPVHSGTAQLGFVRLLPISFAVVWLSGLLLVLLRRWLCWRHLAAIIRQASPLREGREVTLLHRLESRMGIKRSTEIVLSKAGLEPGILGIWRPVLLWPGGISERLEDSHIATILAHELSHVRRHDNLTAMLHMVVEAILWFHPLVWWLGGKLIEERERACDEEVLQTLGMPKAYAEGILSVCKFCAESPLVCASGISGSDLKRRIVRIMTLRAEARLSVGRKLLLVSVAIAAVIGPVTLGILNARAVPVQLPSAEGSTPSSPSFEVASVRPDRSGQSFSSRFTADRFQMERWRVKDLIEYAYNVKEAQVLGVPQWIDSERYDIEAKVDDADMANEQNLPHEQRIALMRLRVRDLLAKRFGLRLHHSLKDLPILALVVARNGPKFSSAKPLPTAAPVPDDRRAYMTMDGKQWVLSLNNFPLSYLVSMLSGQQELAGRILVDKTELTGAYDLKLQWEPQDLASAANFGSERSGATLFTALQEQLGLKVESRKEPVDVVVIDRIERPSEN